MRYQGIGIPSTTITICQLVKYTKLLVYNIDKIKKNKIVEVIYIPSLFSITLELGYIQRFNHLIGQKTSNIGSTKGSIILIINKKESRDNKEEDNKKNNKGKDNKEENNKKEDYKGDNKEEDNIGEEQIPYLLSTNIIKLPPLL